MLNPRELEARITAALPGAQVEIHDTTGTGDHFEARVISEVFQGLSMVEQHQRVYAPLNDLLKSGALHALALKTYSPEQWTRRPNPNAEG